MKVEPSNFNPVLERASARGVLASSLGSAAQRDRFSRSLKRNMMFSARTANADYLSGLFEEINNLLKGGYDNDLPMVRLRIKRLLRRYLYTPKTGFPGDAELGIEPAEPGSLQDLSSDARLNLIIETQTGLMRGAVRRAQDMEPSVMRMFPWWELVRVESRRVPRGSPDSGSLGWPARWIEAAGPAPVSYENKTRLIAPKDHHVWRNLGDSAIFADALDVDHPPFAFRSGWGVRQIHWREGRAMGLDLPAFARPNTKPEPLPANVIQFPSPKASVKRLDPQAKAALLAAMGPTKTTDEILRMSN
jgi:hypothetical protein